MAKSEGMIWPAEAWAIVERALAEVRLPSETVAVREALGRTVVKDQVSALDLPPFDKSAMDGYAILDGDDRQEYRLLETVPAGGVPRVRLTPGTTSKVMTGAPVPEGTGQVIMIERTREADGVVHVLSKEKARNICQKGEDVRRGDVVLRAPAVVGPLEMANLVSAGISEVEVACRPRIVILATGDEIVDSAEQLGQGKIMNSNGPMLAGLCRENGLKVVANSIVADDLDVTVSAIEQALDSADIVVLSGGVSVGDFDFAGTAMRRLELQVHFDQVAVKPGRPMTFATAGPKAVFGLPGNPVSVYLMFHLFVLRAARLIMGAEVRSRAVQLPLARSFQRRKADRLQYVPCRVNSDGSLEAVEFHGSAHLRALLETDGFFLVLEGLTALSAGEKVEFISFKGTLR